MSIEIKRLSRNRNDQRSISLRKLFLLLCLAVLGEAPREDDNADRCPTFRIFLMSSSSSSTGRGKGGGRPKGRGDVGSPAGAASAACAPVVVNYYITCLDIFSGVLICLFYLGPHS